MVTTLYLRRTYRRSCAHYAEYRRSTTRTPSRPVPGALPSDSHSNSWHRLAGCVPTCHPRTAPRGPSGPAFPLLVGGSDQRIVLDGWAGLPCRLPRLDGAAGSRSLHISHRRPVRSEPGTRRRSLVADRGTLPEAVSRR